MLGGSVKIETVGTIADTVEKDEEWKGKSKAAVAQSVEQRTCNATVGGSSPSGGTNLSEHAYPVLTHRSHIVNYSEEDGDLEHLRVVVYRDGDLYMAQGLEVDIATQAKDIPSLLVRLDLTLEAECAMSKERGGAPFAGIGPAPNYFHGLWDKRSVSLKHLLLPVGHHFRVEVALAA